MPASSPTKRRRHTTVSLPQPLFEKLDELIEGTGFGTVSAFVTYVMRQIVSDDTGKGEPFDREEEERIKKRLKSLGYLK